MTDPGTPQALRHLWASPALFVPGAFVAFNVVVSREPGGGVGPDGRGPSGPVVALGWQAVRRERPETAFVVVPLSLAGADDGAVRDRRGVPGSGAGGS